MIEPLSFFIYTMYEIARLPHPLSSSTTNYLLPTVASNLPSRLASQKNRHLHVRVLLLLFYPSLACNTNRNNNFTGAFLITFTFFLYTRNHQDTVGQTCHETITLEMGYGISPTHPFIDSIILPMLFPSPFPLSTIKNNLPPL